ncbi:hypothetical protein Y032_0385g420 [Ancylostoma ceylanicum]|uniref:Uncharacterized protein n=1 Tax=Ancylostoma ceylanicum TaxID=53326 RepID=A0A016RTR7_9BILA|nr:hypothetical protein Y032_0385g420 [Ancylostoma ceylanicum]
MSQSTTTTSSEVFEGLFIVNVRVRVRLGQAVRKIPGYGSALAEQCGKRHLPVFLAQSVRKTQGYGSALEKQWGQRPDTGPPMER